MHPFSPVPDTVYSRPGSANVGAFAGGLRTVDHGGDGLGTLARIARRKKWLYVAIARPDVFVAFAIVRLGYAANTFAFVCRPSERRLAFDRSWVLPPNAIQVADGLRHTDLALVRGPGAHASVRYDLPADRMRIDLDYGDLGLHVVLDADPAPPPVTVIAPVAGGPLNVTEKRALLSTTGEMTLGRERIALDGALAGYDYTHGMLARRTAWQWGFGLGHTADGTPVGFNLSDGFVGRHENVAWHGRDLVRLGDARFTYDVARPLDRWKVSSSDATMALEFEPAAMHAERKNLLVVRSQFVQPVGRFSGTIRVGDTQRALADVIGVVEHQDVIW